jgi:hypothetical protein
MTMRVSAAERSSLHVLYSFFPQGEVHCRDKICGYNLPAVAELGEVSVVPMNTAMAGSDLPHRKIYNPSSAPSTGCQRFSLF